MFSIILKRAFVGLIFFIQFGLIANTKRHNSTPIVLLQSLVRIYHLRWPQENQCPLESVYLRLFESIPTEYDKYNV